MTSFSSNSSAPQVIPPRRRNQYQINMLYHLPSNYLGDEEDGDSDCDEAYFTSIYQRHSAPESSTLLAAFNNNGNNKRHSFGFTKKAEGETLLLKKMLHHHRSQSEQPRHRRIQQLNNNRHDDIRSQSESMAKAKGAFAGSANFLIAPRSPPTRTSLTIKNGSGGRIIRCVSPLRIPSTKSLTSTTAKTATSTAMASSASAPALSAMASAVAASATTTALMWLHHHQQRQQYFNDAGSAGVGAPPQTSYGYLTGASASTPTLLSVGLNGSGNGGGRDDGGGSEGDDSLISSSEEEPPSPSSPPLCVSPPRTPSTLYPPSGGEGSFCLDDDDFGEEDNDSGILHGTSRLSLYEDDDEDDQTLCEDDIIAGDSQQNRGDRKNMGRDEEDDFYYDMFRGTDLAGIGEGDGGENLTRAMPITAPSRVNQIIKKEDEEKELETTLSSSPSAQLLLNTIVQAVTAVAEHEAATDIVKWKSYSPTFPLPKEEPEEGKEEDSGLQTFTTLSSESSDSTLTESSTSETPICEAKKEESNVDEKPENDDNKITPEIPDAESGNGGENREEKKASPRTSPPPSLPLQPHYYQYHHRHQRSSYSPVSQLVASVMGGSSTGVESETMVADLPHHYQYQQHHKHDHDYHRFLTSSSSTSDSTDAQGKKHLEGTVAKTNGEEEEDSPSTPVQEQQPIDNKPPEVLALVATGLDLLGTVVAERQKLQQKLQTQPPHFADYTFPPRSNTGGNSKNSKGKCVRFADDCGLHLETIRVMTEPSDYPPCLPLSLLRRYRKAAALYAATVAAKTLSPEAAAAQDLLVTAANLASGENADDEDEDDEGEESSEASENGVDRGLSSSSSPKAGNARSSSFSIGGDPPKKTVPTSQCSSWVLGFKQPASDYVRFRHTLDEGKIALENVMLRNEFGRMVGTIKVANVAFEKHVFVRLSVDAWRSYMDRAALYQSSPSKCYDTFRFDVDIPKNSDPDAKVEFCVCLVAGPSGSFGEYWDSNGGKNFVLTSPRPDPLAFSSTSFFSSSPNRSTNFNNKSSSISSSFSTSSVPTNSSTPFRSAYFSPAKATETKSVFSSGTGGRAVTSSKTSSFCSSSPLTIPPCSPSIQEDKDQQSIQPQQPGWAILTKRALDRDDAYMMDCSPDFASWRNLNTENPYW